MTDREAIQAVILKALIKDGRWTTWEVKGAVICIRPGTNITVRVGKDKSHD